MLDISSGNGSSDYSPLFNNEIKSLGRRYSYDNGSFMDELRDSLKLTRTILPGLLPLLNLDDYKSSMMQLLAEMVDSNLVSQNDYEMYFSKFLIEAKQELKNRPCRKNKKLLRKQSRERRKKEYRKCIW